MKNFLLLAGFFCFGALSSIFWTRYNHREKMDINNTVVRLSALKTVDENKAIGKALSTRDKAQLLEAAKALVLDRNSFSDLVFNTNRLDIMATEAMIQRLRSNDPKLVAALFMIELEEIGSSEPEARAQLIFAANRLQADELLPFWKDLALRTTPRSEDEAKVLGLSELSMDGKVIHGEMAAAIRNLGLIGYREAAARAALELIVLHPQPLSHKTFVREYAFYALKEADEGAVIRLLRSLSASDPLRESLKSALTAL